MLVVPSAAVLAVPALSSPAGANGVALASGNVLASVGNGLVDNYSPSGTLADTLDTGTASTYTTGGCFDSSGNFYVTDIYSDEISKFDSGGNLVASTWATVPSAAESCTVDASNNMYVGGPFTPSIYEFNSSGTLINTFPVAGGTGTGGADWVDLAADQCTILYTGEGSEIRSYNVCTQTQNADFATTLPAPCFALRVRPNGDVMVACASEVLRFDSSGNLIQTYTLSNTSELFAMNLDPDNNTFWTGETGGEIYHVDIATGAVLSQFNSSPVTGLYGLTLVGEINVAQQLPTTLTTSLSGGGSSGLQISVLPSTPVTDSATLTGTSAATATGKVTYSVYTDSLCQTTPVSTDTEDIVTAGTLPASAPVSLPTPGTYFWQASYSGDTSNLSSVSNCGDEVETVLAPQASGAFLIGDKSAGNLQAGTKVNFWGAQWAKNNALSGGSAPAALKGFTDNPTTASCGATWSTRPGNSASPPGTLPSQIVVIVTSKATKSGSTISGNTVHVVLVNVGPGYGPAPGHAGIGTIASVVC